MYVPHFQLKGKHMYCVCGGGGSLPETDGRWFHSNPRPAKTPAEDCEGYGWSWINLTAKLSTLKHKNIHKTWVLFPIDQFVNCVFFQCQACKKSHHQGRRYFCCQTTDVQPISLWIKLLVKNAGLKQTKPTPDWVCERTGWELYSPWKAQVTSSVSHSAPSP